MLPSSKLRPASPQLDLSHLSKDEREVIQSVIERQKALESETFVIESDISRELSAYQLKREARSRNSSQKEEVKKAKDEIVCEICRRTVIKDFAKGKTCKYCKMKVCDNCGEQVKTPATVKSPRSLFSFVQDIKALTSGTEVFWLCVICKKKQELLAKTGSWFHSRNTKDIETIRDIETELSTPPSHSPIRAEARTSGKSSLNPISISQSNSEQYGTSLPKPYTPHSGSTSPEVTKPILVRSSDGSDTNSLRRENKENLSDYSDSSSYLSDTQSRKKTVTFGKNDVIQTHVEYIEDMNRLKDSYDDSMETQKLNIVEPSIQMNWSPPDNDNKCIGDILISLSSDGNRNYRDYCTALGFKVVGGRRNEEGKKVAIVTDVIQNSIADKDIKLLVGDEILDWNEISLVDCTDEEVQDIIAMDDSCDLHLVISRDRSSMETQELAIPAPRQYENGLPTAYNSFSPRGNQQLVAESPTQNLSLLRGIDSPRGSSISSGSPSSSPSQVSSHRSADMQNQLQHNIRSSSVNSTPEHQRYLSPDERNFSSDEEDIGLPYRLKILQHKQRRVIIYLDISTYFQ